MAATISARRVSWRSSVREACRRLIQMPHFRLWIQFFVAGIVVSQVSLSLLRPGVHDRAVLMSVNVTAQLVIAVGTLAMPERARLTKLWPPFIGLLALIVLGLTTHNLAPALTGFFVITFVYVGLTQPAWTSMWLIVPAVTAWLLINRPLTHTNMAKLPVAVSLWVLLAELLSRVTAHQQADQDRLADEAAHDALTGLRNRRGLEELLAAAEVGDAVLFLDLDHFKAVNDLLGHEAGDQVIADLGRIVLAVLRPHDVAVRYGGEEVLILLPGTSVDGVESLLHRLHRGWSASHPELTFSAGIAIVDEQGGAAAAREADDALYLAKQRGRNRAEVAGQRPAMFIPTQKGAPAPSKTGR
jgi:diguanylate cyclase (GGDEF)-like protein